MGGGGASLVTQYWGEGKGHFFLLILYNFKNIGGGPSLVTQYWGWGGGDTRHFFSLILYNFKNIGGGGTFPPGLPTPRSLLPGFDLLNPCIKYQHPIRQTCHHSRFKLLSRLLQFPLFISSMNTGSHVLPILTHSSSSTPSCRSCGSGSS